MFVARLQYPSLRLGEGSGAFETFWWRISGINGCCEDLGAGERYAGDYI